MRAIRSRGYSEVGEMEFLPERLVCQTTQRCAGLSKKGLRLIAKKVATYGYLYKRAGLHHYLAYITLPQRCPIFWGERGRGRTGSNISTPDNVT